MKVIVFGGSGFLGSHVADAFSRHGHKVTIFDCRESQWIQNRQTFIQGDILSCSDIKKALNGQDVVYHMAGISDIDECHKQPLDTVKFNILGSTNIFHESVNAKIKKVIFASSIYVYSNSGSFYRASKQSCELLLESYAEKFGLRYVILRYGSLYGPRSDARNSVFKILQQAIIENCIVYKGTGEEKREFIHVEDAAELSVSVLDEKHTNQSIILTGNESIRYSDLLEMVKEVMNGDIQIKYIPSMSSTHYNLSPYSFLPKRGKKLSNNPRIDLGQGLVGLMDEIYRNQNMPKSKDNNNNFFQMSE